MYYFNKKSNAYKHLNITIYLNALNITFILIDTTIFHNFIYFVSTQIFILKKIFLLLANKMAVILFI